ncbi:MAG: hypothetical protein JST11_25645, partial [Acidobacteria bacterium]|nr:hypothetical protein [Acidobacteriota bacterium]
AIYQEWRGSAHRWSGEDEFFQTVRGVMTELHGTGVTEKCAACHEPVSLFSGHKDPRLGSKSVGYHEGDSCVVCHAARKMDERGIGSYTLGTPTPYLYERSASPLARGVSRFLVRVYPAQHSLDYSLVPARKPESCAPCHKEYDVVIEQQGPVQVETQFDDWKQNKWNTDRDPAKRLYCQQCHMYLKEASEPEFADPYDARVGLGRKHRNHDFAAANQYMPRALASPDSEGQIRRVEQWLRGEQKVPEIAKVWPDGPVIATGIAVPRDPKPGEESDLQISLTNRKAGHGFPTGPLNIVRAWLEVTVRDSAGREIFHSGKLDAENHIEDGSYILKPIAIDPRGNIIMEPDIWHPKGPRYRPAVEPGKTDTFDYRFRVPRDAHGPLSVQARLRYRKANQFFVDSVYPGMHRTLPVTDVSSATAIVRLAGEGL